MATVSVKTVKALSLDRRSTTSGSKRISITSESKLISSASSDNKRPTPLDFDCFLPWICKQMQVVDPVVVTRKLKETFPVLRRTSASKPKSVRSARLKSGDSASKKIQSTITNTDVSDGAESRAEQILENAIPVTTYYDTNGQLVEIAIIGRTTDVPRKVIQVINLCLPFHPLLTKLSIRKGGVHSALLYEIGKMLPHSHLTEVYLDDTSVPECNYHVLLNSASSMKHLSLSRCNITDYVCSQIFSRISYGCPAAKSLMILNLSSNFITDTGAKFIGDVLRTNRDLLHLNLSGNRITDAGLSCIVKHLKEFPLTHGEILAKKRRYLEYSKNRLTVFQKCIDEIALTSKSEVLSSLLDKRASLSADKHAKVKKGKKIPPQINVEELSETEQAEKMTKNIVGEFCDVFDDNSIVRRDNYCYSVGNLRFSSLNVSYNRLEFRSLLRILEVLTYQSMFKKKLPNTGLLRIVVEGNAMPQSCPELKKIESYLSQSVNTQIPASILSPFCKKLTSGSKHASIALIPFKRR